MSGTPMTPERLAEIAVRAAHLYEYVQQPDEADVLAGTDVPALLARVAELEAERHSTNEALSDAAEALRVDRDRIAGLAAEREKLIRWHGEDSKTINRLVARVERRQAELVALRNDALNMRGSLAPADGDRKVPFELGETLTPAVDWLIGRVAELEALKPAPIQTCRTCGAGYTHGQPCSTCEFQTQMALAQQQGGCPRNVIDGDVGGHFFKKGALSDSPVACVYCGAVKPEGGDAR